MERTQDQPGPDQTINPVGAEPPAVRSQHSARARALKAAVALAMLAGMFLSKNLWYPNRTYPLAPVWNGLPAIPPWLGQAWYWTLLGLLVVVAILPRPRLFLWLFVTLATLLSMWDQTRWQPWVYQYVFMLFCLGFYPWRHSDSQERRREAVLNSCRIVIAGMYVWSGLQKFNVSFATTVFPWLIEPIVPPIARPFAHTGALLVPVVETAIGVGLLLARFRGLAVLLALGMHAVVLYCLGPWGHNWNTVVWPWNVAMMGFVVALFWNTPALRFWSIVWPGRSFLHWLALALFGVMPAFSFCGRWDAYLSATLYSGNTTDGQIVVSAKAYDDLPPEIRARLIETYPGRYEFFLFGWSMDELNVPDYPAERVYRKIARSLTAHTDPAEVVLTIQHPPHWLTGERKTTVYRGDELGR